FALQPIDLRREPGPYGEAQIVLQRAQVEASGEPETGEEALAEMLVGAELLHLRLSQAGRLDSLEVALRRAVVHPAPRDGGTAGQPAEPARAASRRGVFQAAPVERVVHRLVPRPCVVGDLVSRIPRSPQLAADGVAHGGL